MSNETKIGIFAVLTIALFIWGYKFLKGQNLLHRSNVFYVEYANVEGIKASTPVLINGMEVGVVTGLRIKPDDAKKIVVSLNINRGFDIPKTAVAEIVSTSILSGKLIRLTFDKVCSGADCAQDGDFLKGESLSLLRSMVAPGEVDVYTQKMRESLQMLSDSISADLNDPNAKHGIAKNLRDIDVVLENLKQATAQVKVLMNGSSKGINSIVNNLNGVTSNLKANNTKIDSILGNTAAFTGSLKQLNLNKTVKGTDDAMLNLKKTLETSEKTVAELNKSIKKLQASDNTFGKLLNDASLYNNLERTSRNLDLLLQDFRLNPKRYVNVSVFGKKQKEYQLPQNDPADKIDSAKFAPPPPIK